MRSSTPGVTCEEACGPLEFVRSGETGLVSEASPEALAGAMDRLFADRAFALQAGRAGRSLIDQMRISWEHVVGRLLA